MLTLVGAKTPFVFAPTHQFTSVSVFVIFPFSKGEEYIVAILLIGFIHFLWILDVSVTETI